ncbi:MAG: Rne/Rng family ribonuclease [Christensenellaceae bacterium]|nr:Rne/Rng family ribonuclease [Christensenellaceae bacterium]
MRSLSTYPIDKKIIIDVNPYRTCVALLENARVAEFYMEHGVKDSLVGNIYRGRVQNILPGMPAAFIDINEGKNAFLNIRETDESSFNFEGEHIKVAPKSCNSRSSIKIGQDLMVQVVKEPYGSKGARVSTHISLPGHTLVYMPTIDFVGISKRITDESERNRLRTLIEDLRPNGEGVIVRTAAAECDEELIRKDLLTLIETWKSIECAYNASRAPKLIYNEASLIARTLRDIMKPDVRRLTVNSRVHYEQLLEAAAYMEGGMAERIVLCEEENLFDTFKIDAQIKEALSRKVWLKSGAYIVIDQTEALVSIDVNTGKNIGKLNLKKTIVDTNCEAAVEIARQIRLRNLSGIIIIDFIDMDEKSDRETVLSTLREAVKQDGTRTVVYGMTELGLVEVARKKLRTDLSSKLQIACPYCDGEGRVLSVEAVSIKLRERLHTMCADGAKRVIVTANPAVIGFMQETDCNTSIYAMPEVLWKAEPTMHIEKFTIKELI